MPVFYRRYAEDMASTRDRELVQIVDAAMAEAVHRGGDWIACRPGCHECCLGTFPITQADARRLREGLGAIDPERAERVRQRARNAVDENDDDPCPALDPATGTCDLYAWRPITCRTFGPALRLNSDSVDTCELCYEGATDDEILSTLVELNIADRELELEAEAAAETGLAGETTVAFALR